MVCQCVHLGYLAISGDWVHKVTVPLPLSSNLASVFPVSSVLSFQLTFPYGGRNPSCPWLLLFNSFAQQISNLMFPQSQNLFLSLTICWITLVRLKVANTACSVFSLHMPDPGNVEMIPFYIRGSRIEGQIPCLDILLVSRGPGSHCLLFFSHMLCPACRCVQSACTGLKLAFSKYSLHFSALYFSFQL